MRHGNDDGRCTGLHERGRARRPHPAARAVAGRGDGRDARPDRAAQPEPQRPHLPRPRRCAKGSAARRGRGDARRRARAAPRRAGGDQGPVRLQARLAGDLRRRPRAQGQHRPLVLPLRRADREGRRDPRRQDQRPGDGAPRHLRQPAVRPDPQPVRHAAQCRRLVRRQRRGGRRRAPAARRGHRCGRLDPHPGRVVRRLRLQGLLRPHPRRHPAECLCRRPALRLRGPDHPHRRGRRARPHRPLRLRPARSAQPRRDGRISRPR